MKVVFLHTDLRIYWAARLQALSLLLKQHNISLEIIEIAGAGSNYDFALRNKDVALSWRILFPSDKMEDLHSLDIKSKVLLTLDSLQPDIVIAGAIAFPSGALAVRWAQKNKKKVIIFDDAQIENVRRNFFVNYIKQAVYNGVDAMFYPSKVWHRTGSFWGFTKKNMFYGLDVVDNEYWQQSIDFNKDLPIDYFLCVGRQVSKKNFITILKAYKSYVNKVTVPYKLMLIGNGEEHSSLLHYVEQNDLTDFVIFKPFVQQKDLISIYRQARAFIIASGEGETWGLVINEAMASGLPIIASDKCGATSTLVEHGSNGFIFSPYDVERLEFYLVKFHNLTNIERKSMSLSSIGIIKDWNLEKFAKSLYMAILFVNKTSKRKLTFIDRCIINLWNGRYRPT